jgi:RNA polymerase sigma factor (sigma-70 family)
LTERAHGVDAAARVRFATWTFRDDPSRRVDRGRDTGGYHSVLRASRFRDDDGELVKAISEGNRTSIEHFFGRFEKLIYSVIHRTSWVENQDINDLYNGFFIHLAEDNFRRIIAWQRKAALGTYIIKMLINYIRDYYRSRGQRPAGTEPIDENWPDDTDSVDKHFDRARLKDFLVEAKKTLSDRDRKIMCLKLFRDLEPGVCARELGLSDGTFYTAYHRAEKRLVDAFRNLHPLLFEKDL